MTQAGASPTSALPSRPAIIGFGLGLVASLVLAAEVLIWIGLDADVSPNTRILAMLATAATFGAITAVVARGRPAWAGLMTGLVAGAFPAAFITAAGQPDNPYARGPFMVLVAVLLGAFGTIGGSIGFGVVAAGRRFGLPAWAQVLAPLLLAACAIAGGGVWGALSAWSDGPACKAPARVDGLAGRLAYANRGSVCVADLGAGTAITWYPSAAGSGGDIREPAWSRGGTQLLGVRYWGPAPGQFPADDELAVGDELVTVGPDGSVTPLSVPVFVGYEDPDWSPDGARIAGAGGGQLYLGGADGSNWSQVATGVALDEVAHPTWSPAGDAVAFLGTANLEARLYVLDLRAGSAARPIAEASFDASPSWSPDGRWIAFEVSDPDTAVPSINLVRPDGGDLHQVVGTESEASFHPAWSPDGAWLAFLRQPMGAATASIWVVRSDGSGARAVSVGAAEGQESLGRGPSLDWTAVP